MYRVLVNDFSFLFHSDSHSAKINDISFGKDSDKFVAIDENGARKVWDLDFGIENGPNLPFKLWETCIA
jgi:WD40 repeat protein